MSDAAQARDQCWVDIQLDQAEHLRVAVLLHHVDAIMFLDEVVDFAGEWICLKPQVVGLDVVLVTQLISAFEDSPMRCAVCDDSDF